MDKKFIDGVVDFRRSIHAKPETGFVEHDTHATIMGEMKALGIPDEDVKVLAGTGIIADIRGTGPPIGAGPDGAALPAGGGPGDVVIAVRADIDALPMTEETGDLPWRSTRPGAAHMCGHDGHMANLMGLARLVAGRRERLPSDRVLRLVWQPAEEGPGGAKPMVEAGAMVGVSEVYGFHNWPTFPLGSVHVVAGPAMAHVTDFDVRIRGRGGHASAPHVLADPVVAAAHCIVALQTVVSRSVHSADAAVVSVSTIHGGETRNVIPSDVTFSGTIRDLSPAAGDVIGERFPAVVRATAEAHGCSAEVELRSLYPVLRNDEAAAGHCRRVGERVLGAGRAPSWGLPLMGGEDFGYFSDEVPGCYVFFGTAEQGRRNHMLHSSHFDFNDRVLPRTLAFFLRLAEDRWGIASEPLYAEDEVPSFDGVTGVPPPDWRTAPPTSDGTDRVDDVAADAAAMGRAEA